MKKQIYKNITKLDFKASNSKKYKQKVIQNKVIYIKQLKMSYLPKLYYFFKKII